MNNKQQYTAPQIRFISVEVQGVIATSPGDPAQQYDKKSGSSQLTQRKSIWDSSMWTEEE